VLLLAKVETLVCVLPLDYPAVAVRIFGESRKIWKILEVEAF